MAGCVAGSLVQMLPSLPSVPLLPWVSQRPCLPTPLAPAPTEAVRARPDPGPQAACCLCGTLRAWLCPLTTSGSSTHSLKEQKNLNSFFAVMFGLSNSAISRLAHTWEVGVRQRARAHPGGGC